MCSGAGSHFGEQTPVSLWALQRLSSFEVSFLLPQWLSGLRICLRCRRHRRHGFNPWVRQIPWRRAGQPTPVFLPGEFHGQRSLVGYSPWGLKESDTTEQLILSFTFCSVKHFAGMLQIRLAMPLNLLASLLRCTAPCSVIRCFGGPGEVGSLLLVRPVLTFPEPTAQCGAAPACEHQRHLCRSCLWVRGL